MNVTLLITLISLPLITGLIGWLTNLVAIKMLFRPKNPIRIFFWKCQGLIPRRQNEIATRTAQIVENEILTQHLLRTELEKIDLKPFINELATNLIYHGVERRLRSMPVIGGLINDTTLFNLHTMAVEEMNKQSKPMVTKIADEAEKKLPVGAMVEERIKNFEVDQLEKVVHRVASSEFRNIELLGGVLGFIVGILQLVILYATGHISL